MDFSDLAPRNPGRRRRQSAAAKAGVETDGRPLTKLYVEPTARCNLQCRTCMRHSWDEKPGDMDELTLRALLQGIDGIPSLETVALWGLGEPLLHPGTVEIIRKLNSRGLRTELITNGTLLDRSMSQALADAGLDTLVVSLDGANPETHGLIRDKSDLAAIVENIQGLNAVKKGIKGKPEIGIEFVLSRGNITELKDLLPLAGKMQAAFVLVSNLLPYSASMKDEILYWLRARSYAAPILAKGRPDLLLPSLDLREENLQHLREVIPGFKPDTGASWRSDAPDGFCPFIERGSLSIAWDGRVAPCIALLHEHRCYVLGKEKLVKSYAVGNVRSSALKAIWDEREFKSFRARVREFDFSPCTGCGGCDFFKSNEEDCVGSPFPTCGGCLWAKGILLCP